MDIKEILKKFWFVILTGVVLVGFVIYYGVNMTKTEKTENIKVNEKVDSEGNSVIFSLDGLEYTAQDLKNDMGDSYATTIKLYALQKEVCKDIKTTDEIAQYVVNYISYLKQQYSEEDLLDEAKLLGFQGKSAITDLLTTQLKSNDLAMAYLEAHQDELSKAYYDENEPKLVSHILIKVADVTETEDENGNKIHTANPTAEEKAKLDAILAALENGEDFATVAAANSEDTGSAANNGSLGLVTKASVENYVPEFKDAVNALSKTGDRSEVITTTYGYHIINIDKAGYEDLKDTDEFKTSLLQSDKSIMYRAIFERADELNIKFANAEDEALIKAYCGLEAE